MSDDLSRRDFLSVCSVLAASFAACSSTTQRMRVASSFVVDPALDDYRPALHALIETILPHQFPLDVATVEQRLLHMFPLEDERRFLGLQRTLVYFDQLDLAPHVAAPLLASERVALDVPARISENEFRRESAAKIERESRECDAFFQRFGRNARFAPLAPDARLAWLRVWGTSQFAVKREFAQSLRVLVLISAYSADAVWPAIGYAGPLINRPERRS
jgi:hypothetical protein